MSTKALNVVQLSAVVPSRVDAKDSREFNRSRQLNMKPHDRAKAHVKRSNGAVAKLPKEEPRNKAHHVPRSAVARDEDDALDYAIRSIVDVGNHDVCLSTELRRPPQIVEVPILTIIRSSQPWDGIGADFELVSYPDDVIALDGDVDYSDDEWETVDEFNHKMNDKRSYAAALKGGL